MMEPIHKSTMLKEVRINNVWKGYVSPNKVNGFHVYHGWHLGMNVIITIGRDGEYYYVSENAQDSQLLSDFISNYLYYNGNPELGKHIRFWNEL